MGKSDLESRVQEEAYYLMEELRKTNGGLFYNSDLGRLFVLLSTDILGNISALLWRRKGVQQRTKGGFVYLCLLCMSFHDRA